MRRLHKAFILFGLAGLGLLNPSAATTASPFKAESHPKKQKEPPIKVTKVSVRPLKTSLKPVSCPVNHTFYGTIVTNGATAVKYTWVTSDGKPHDQQALNAENAGPNTVTQEWTAGEPGKAVHDWIQLKVTSPNTDTSQKMKFTLHCAK